MTDQEIVTSGLLEQYILGLCSPEEEELVCARCRLNPVLAKAKEEAELALENYYMTQGQSYMYPTASNEPKTGLGSPAPLHPIRPSKSFWKPLAIAASVAVVASAGWNIYQYQQNKEMKFTESVFAQTPTTEALSLPLRDFRVMQDPKITPVGLLGVGSHSICRCTLYWDKASGKVYLMIHHLPRTDESEDFQLWAMVNGKPVSIGLINDGTRDRFIELTGAPGTATSFVVTLEKGGGAQTPNMEEVYLKGSI